MQIKYIFLKIILDKIEDFLHLHPKISREKKMGKILSTKRYSQDERKVVVETLLNNSEFLNLKGHLNEIHLFSDAVAEVPARISLRGKNEATKYFLIPKLLRRNLKFNTKVNCQRIDSEDKAIFVYVVDNY